MTRLCDALAVPRGVTAVVGGGGKTALIERLARELSRDARVLRLTTARMWPPEGELLLAPTPERLARAFARAPLVTAGEACPDGKLRAPDAPLRALAALADYVLVEADGSRGLPFKAPADHEPALPGGEALVVAVAGVSGLGRPIREVAHRPDCYAALLGKTLFDRVTPADMATALLSDRGQRKNVNCRFAVALNQCDTEADEARACEAARLLPCECVLLALRARPGWLRTKEDIGC